MPFLMPVHPPASQPQQDLNRPAGKSRDDDDNDDEMLAMSGAGRPMLQLLFCARRCEDQTAHQPLQVNDEDFS